MRERVSEDTVRRLIQCMVDAGVSPAYHSAQLIRLRYEWPTLASAISALMFEVGLVQLPREWAGVGSMMPKISLPSTTHLQGLEAQNIALRQCLAAAGVADSLITKISDDAYANATKDMGIPGSDGDHR